MYFDVAALASRIACGRLEMPINGAHRLRFTCRRSLRIIPRRAPGPVRPAGCGMSSSRMQGGRVVRMRVVLTVTTGWLLATCYIQEEGRQRDGRAMELLGQWAARAARAACSSARRQRLGGRVVARARRR